MGFLEVGVPLSWWDSLPYIAYVREHGVAQFIRLFNSVKGRTNDVLKWGDEIEYHLVELPPPPPPGELETRAPRIALCAPEILAKLEAEDARVAFPIPSAWRPEFGAWMVEATPGVPYGGATGDLTTVERNMAMRRWRISVAAPHGVLPFSIPAFPLLGCSAHTTAPPAPPGGAFSKSAYLSDAVLSPHPRFGALAANIRRRRGSKVDIRVPLFLDTATRPDAMGLEAQGDGSLLLRQIADPRLSAQAMAAATAWPSAVPAATQATQFAAEALAWKEARSSSSSSSSARALAPSEPAQQQQQQATAPPPAAQQPPSPAAAGAPATPPSASRASFDVTLSPSLRALTLGGGATAAEMQQLAPLDAPPPSTAAAAAAAVAAAAPTSAPTSAPAPTPAPPSVHMDAMAFGMGCCCLQVTFQARDLAESRVLYDQLAPWTPLLLALTANTPILRGHLVATDTRWEVISGSVDCRTPLERGLRGGGATALPWQGLPEARRTAGGGGAARIAKSRYSSIDCYISESELLVEGVHNDLPVVCDGEAERALRAAGLDARLARHVAHLFIRDPLVMFEGRISELSDALFSEHFESIQSTNWRSMRWKPPPSAPQPQPQPSGGGGGGGGGEAPAPPGPDIGWRVEFRSMEVQMTDFENAAFTVFVVLLSRVILFFNLNFYMPLSLVDENFKRADVAGAATGQLFWFPRHCTPCSPSAASGSGSTTGSTTGSAASDAPRASPRPTPTQPPTQLSLLHILQGDGSDDFPGIMPLVLLYLDINGCDAASRAVIETYLQFIVNRARGAALTGAAWQRDFVARHPLYRQDSVVCPGIATDLLRAVAELGRRVQGMPSSPLLAPLVGPLGSGASGSGASEGAATAASAAAAAAAMAAAAAAPAGANPSTRLRGSSFFKDTATRHSKCSVLRSLMRRFKGSCSEGEGGSSGGGSGEDIGAAVAAAVAAVGAAAGGKP